ncbi:MAG: primosomal protein N' (replication factor Y) - superfamily II helicase, partial [Pseudomonadota bacterium]
MATPAATTADYRFPCDACGADLRYDPAADQLLCDHCGNTETVGSAGPWAGSIKELDFARAINHALDSADIEETRVNTCPNCGAQTAFDPDIHAAKCPFCATPVVTGTGAHRHIKPRGLLPFDLAEGQARDAMAEWLGSLWFAPNGLQEYARKGRPMNGIYVPYWTFDADTKSRYTGQRGKHYYETRTVVRDGKRRQVRVRKTRWRNVSGSVARFFDDVLVLASRALPKKYTDGL